MRLTVRRSSPSPSKLTSMSREPPRSGVILRPWCSNPYSTNRTPPTLDPAKKYDFVVDTTGNFASARNLSWDHTPAEYLGHPTLFDGGNRFARISGDFYFEKAKVSGSSRICLRAIVWVEEIGARPNCRTWQGYLPFSEWLPGLILRITSTLRSLPDARKIGR